MGKLIYFKKKKLYLSIKTTIPEYAVKIGAIVGLNLEFAHTW